MKNKINEKRVRLISKGIDKETAILYWMNRDQRVQDNWALLFAQEIALKNQAPLYVIFDVNSSLQQSTLRHTEFMLKGLENIDRDLMKLNIEFVVLTGESKTSVTNFISSYSVGAMVTDFSPLRPHQELRKHIASKISIPMYEVDAHNIVPCWVTSSKLEYSAYTFRPKIHSQLHEFLEEFPKVQSHPFSNNKDRSKNNWKTIRSSLSVNTNVGEVDWLLPGEHNAHKMFEKFLEKRLNNYNEARNNPNVSGQSNLSPYLHFGHISAQRIALEIQKFSKNSFSSDSFLEELIVRKELSDNFCFYQPYYDSFNGFPTWAKETLNKHRNDSRMYRYSLEQFECAQTHDDLWNASQLEMVRKGKMHGYLRMYWAKKILEWSNSPEEALQIAIHLNDKYELDGCNPNGYTGIAWSIGGVHDRAWGERNIFGKIRYMSYEGCKRKFDINSYIQQNL